MRASSRLIALLTLTLHCACATDQMSSPTDQRTDRYAAASLTDHSTAVQVSLQYSTRSTPDCTYGAAFKILESDSSGTARGGSRKNIWGAWPLVIWEATTAKRNYYRTNYINQ